MLTINSQSLKEENPIELGLADSNPHLRADISENVSVKIGVIKTRFRYDELIKLDVAVLLRNTTPYFFSPKFYYNILVKDSKDRKVSIKPFMVIDGYPRYIESFQTMYMDSTYLIVGCSGYARTSTLAFEAVEDLDNPKELFDREVFGDILDGCIDVSRTGQLSITVEVQNSLVVIDKRAAPVRTLVGSITSSPVKIEVVK
ncbi:MAG: hypothetical protein KF881_07550 [Acidobacteria bacterium]|nr:hypothetical protein [Acidobacteriota bacterium]